GLRQHWRDDPLQRWIWRRRRPHGEGGRKPSSPIPAGAAPASTRGCL
ncbi:MAG: hypothetical protein AVDCRST_MAG61-2197, partial [uncultured Friedmanniella sp.]